MMEALLGFFRRQVGLRTDVASTTGSTLARLAYLINKSPIKSIQRGTISLGKTQITRTATISAVATGKTMLNMLGAEATSKWTISGTSPAYAFAYTGHQFARIALANATEVTVNRATHHDTEMIISYEVVEFV
ncbi:MAG: hypothetical protein M0P69_20950 [Bacteroidales bacterium]|nr:hypothetical protein [Bacteroidales bacterium]